jgi:hypothetical protein
MTPSKVSEITPSRLARDRALFYLGAVLIVAGGPVLSLGSIAHDRYNIPIIGEAYDAFGWLNTLFMMAGIVVLVIGAVFVAISLRGGLVADYRSPEDVP